MTLELDYISSITGGIIKSFAYIFYNRKCLFLYLSHKSRRQHVCMKSFPVHRRQAHSLFIIWSAAALLRSNHEEWFLHTVPDRNEDNASPVLGSALFFHAWHQTSLLHSFDSIHTNTVCLQRLAIILFLLAQSAVSHWHSSSASDPGTEMDDG